MRKVKCRRCSQQVPKEEAYLIIHTTSGGKEQKRYYCKESCYREEERDIFLLKQCQYAIDYILGYTVINNAKNKGIKEILDAGYTREELYDAMVELKEYIIECLNYRKDIESEYQKICYIFAIIKGQIREITNRNKIVESKIIINKTDEGMDYMDYYDTQIHKSSNKRKTLTDMLGGK